MNRLSGRIIHGGLVGLAILIGLLPLSAEAKVITIASGASSASTDSGELDTGGGTVSVQLCGGAGVSAQPEPEPQPPAPEPKPPHPKKQGRL